MLKYLLESKLCRNSSLKFYCLFNLLKCFKEWEHGNIVYMMKIKHGFVMNSIP